MLVVAACEDDIDYGAGDIPEGQSMVRFEMSFKDFSPALESRSAGDAIKAINQLWMIMYNTDGTLFCSRNVSDDIAGSQPADNSQAGPATGYASFRLMIPNGRYRVYAVANMDLSSFDLSVEEKLLDIQAQWESGSATRNAEMFGSFTNESGISDNMSFRAQEIVVENGKNILHAWLYRLASKITVAYDGSGLKEGVSIYIKSLRIKNIPASCYLGKDNAATKAENLIPTGEEVIYSNTSNYDSDYPALITKENPFYPRIQKSEEDGSVSWIKDPDSHSETNRNTLFFYENMQGKGPDKKQTDIDSDGNSDQYDFKAKPYATYIEVEAHYVSSNPERPGISNITYRFMLGQDVMTDYNAKRNCHYKLTLHFNGFANEPDWRIDYVTMLWVTQPETVNYRGEFFEPNQSYPNLGNKFNKENVITVTSYRFESDSWTGRKPLGYKVEYRDAGSKTFTANRPKWLDEFVKNDGGNGVNRLTVMYKNPYREVNIADSLKKNPQKNGIYDLAAENGTMNTANCYMVDSKGTYCFPLVYGNAITGGSNNENSYTYSRGNISNKKQALETFKNYKGEDIRHPYILDDIYGENGSIPSGVKASLVWQDVADLVSGISYDPTAYSNKGGIKFTIGDNIKEGNAVIAIKDAVGTVMWSWHIWVTDLGFSENITLSNLTNQKFEIMPVNLGWCSGDKIIRYYDRHECEVKFTQIIDDETKEEGVSQIIKIVQEPHIAVPRGNNPYFQWGRKDPFIAGGDDNDTNKTWYTEDNTPHTDAPARMYAAGTDSLMTKDAIAMMIKNPDKWQNCPRKVTGAWPPYIPVDSIYFNLWDNNIWDDNDDLIKTVYDPCPVGFHVSSLHTFNGFIADLNKDSDSDYWFSATNENMLDEYTDGIFEFYADRGKLVSLGFPKNGYRDWADNAKITSFTYGYVWLAPGVIWNWSFGYSAYNLEYYHPSGDHLGRVAPNNPFHATDGFPVRPTVKL